MQDRYGSAEGYPIDIWFYRVQHYYEDAWDADTSGSNTVYKRFEVASADAVVGTHKLHTWYQAVGRQPATYRACGDGEWRLPTVRELKLIYDMRDQLASADLPTQGVYWAYTEFSSASTGSAWAVSFSSGNPSGETKTNTYRVRCVRYIK